MPDVKIIADLKEQEQARVAILEDGKLAEIFIEYSFDDDEDNTPENLHAHAKISRLSRQGDIFKAKVENIVPAINAAFVSLTSKNNSGRHSQEPHNAFLYLNEINGLKTGQNIIVQVTN